MVKKASEAEILEELYDLILIKSEIKKALLRMALFILEK